MPQDIVTIEEVHTFDTSKFWTIKGWAHRHDGYREWMTYTTNKPWMASLCDRSKQQGFTVEISWRDTPRFGRDIVTCGRVDQPTSGAA